MRNWAKALGGKWWRALLQPFTFVIFLAVVGLVAPPFFVGVAPHQWYIAADGLTLALIVILSGATFGGYAIHYIRTRYRR